MGSFFLGGFVVVLALLSTSAFASDPDSVQDFCVAVDEPKAALFVNGKFCKNPKDVVDDDFFLSGLNIPGNTANRLGSAITAATVAQLPGLNTLGISISRIDYAPKGLNPPHTHPRATEIFHLQEGILQVGFVTSNNPENRFFSKILHPGDVFVFPVGMIHFQVNIGKTNAVAFVSFNSQNPGLISIASAVFGSKPVIDDKVLAKTFDVDGKVIDLLQAQFN